MRKWRWQLGIALLLVALYGVTHVFAVWWHVPVLLSTSTAVCDLEPRSAISAEGEWLASVWVQGRKVNNGCVSRGAAILRWVTTDAAQTGWSNPFALPLPTEYATGCFVHTDVALDGSTAHIAATVWSPCDGMSANSAILHYTCNLATGACSPAAVASAQPGAEGLRFSDTRIVLDSQNRPHIVYGRGDHTLAQGKLFYIRNLGSGWTIPEQLSSATENAYRPSLAASNGRIHVVWQYHRDYVDTLGRLRQRGDVRYRYCAEEGACNPVIGYPSPTTLVEPTYPIPDVAARGDRVILTWNVCADVDSNPPCESFYLIYARSDTNGSGFPAQPLEVGTDTELRFINISTRYYAGSDDPGNPAGEYGMHLNPSIAINPAGLPYLVWQMQQGAGYVLTTTHAISETEGPPLGFTWAEDALPQFGDGSDNRVYPSLSLATAGDTQALHLTYMHTWQENQWNRSQVYYDVASPVRPIVQLNYTERTSPLPQERAQVITAHVAQQDGTPFSNVPVLIKTTLGSFDPNDYGVSQLQTTTDAQGATTVTLYSNLVGTAQVSAWIDSVANATWDAGEPGAALTQTWVFSGTPSLSVLSEPVEAGQWITVTVRDHPYADLSDPYSTGEPLNYFMWWCPTTAPEYPPAQQLGDDFQVDIDTWERANMMVRVPMGMAGVYHIETHLDTGGSVPCGNEVSLVAASATLTATAAPPSLTVSPGPVMGGQWMTTTVLNHPYSDIGGEPLNYYLWWCPVAAPAAPLTQQIGEPFQVDSDTWSRSNWTFRAPFGINGTYRLETHNANVETPCSHSASRVAASASIVATSDYPPGPLITLNNDQPYPDMVIVATLRQHANGVYDVWWCTDYGSVVEQRVVSAVTVNSDAVPTSVRVPVQVSGLYHVESHTTDPGAGCGNVTTYVGSSALIWPYNRIYLPLVMRARR